MVVTCEDLTRVFFFLSNNNLHVISKVTYTHTKEFIILIKNAKLYTMVVASITHKLCVTALIISQ